MNPTKKTQLLEQIAAIPAMERGKLSPHSSGRHQKLQCWQGGKNHTRHVAADELPAVESALAGYATAPNGKRLAFAIFTANEDKRAASDRATQDSPPGAAVWNRKAKKLQQALIERWVGVYAG